MSGVADTFRAQSQAISAWASGVDAAEWAADLALPHWSVRDLLAHLVVVHESLARAWGTASTEPPLALGAYVSTYAAHAEELERRAQERATSGSTAELIAALGEVRAGLTGADCGSDVLASVRGPITRADFLRTRVVELTVHSDDLARSLPDRPGPALDPDAVTTTVGVLLQALAQQRPGAGQRVIVPGVGAVEADGASGVFEVTPLAALRIFTGRLAPEASGLPRFDPTWGPVLA